MTTNLSTQELERYQKHILLPEIGLSGQKKLKEAKVLVVGAGGLGCPVLLYLVSAGVGSIGIVDDDIVSLSNLQRQVLYTADSVGKSKVETAKNSLQAINPEITIRAYAEKFSLENAAQLLQEYDLIIDCTDNLATRYAINDACIRADKPFIYGSIHRYEGQVAVFNYTDAQGNTGPSYRCLFPEAAHEIANCAETGVLGVLPGMIGMYQALEAIKLITSIGKNLSGKLLLIDTLTYTQRILTVKRNEEEIRKVKEGEYTNAKAIQACASEASYKNITPEELHQLIESQSEFILVDVREGNRMGNIDFEPNMTIPFTHLPGYIDELDQEPMVVVYCQTGRTSTMAAQLLAGDYGLANIYNLSGGLIAWQQRNGALVK
ncbi:molybdopterin-synthase adenylyltransferase MoeB [Rhodocytophaga rosea]|uniref:Molybdopterin-synthase adenylyltransferase n=1 Tax=Rhodocytophaga rosea TaxID=2704465 RepID=A0A6C0GFW4_9BACT|nr:molybdopterin-synthase adenylyltransferase MoeB [Rhodocytophaga rosea]QHT66714.1 molybdopterin-synthase adenylyltransferase MoeB [Rhodocytophaga rosea]